MTRRQLGWLVAGVLGVCGLTAASTNGPFLPHAEWCPADKVPSVFGPVPVKCVPGLTVDGEDVYGAYFPMERIIRLRAGLPRDFMRGVLEHETCHLAMTDADLDPPPEIAERICDAIATQRMGRS